jgi:signal transduction histidine kinase/CheY-like chemotaxis protein
LNFGAFVNSCAPSVRPILTRHRGVLLFTFLAAMGTTQGANSRQGAPLVTSYPVAEGGPDATAWIVRQAPTGEICVGTATALNVFDGDRWRSFPIGNSGNLRAINFSADGKRLWAGSSGDLGWYEKTNTGEWVFHSLLPLVPRVPLDFENLWSVLPTESGVFFVLKDTILRWDGTAMQVYRFHPPLRIESLMFEGSLFIDDGANGLFRFNGHGFTLVIPESKMRGSRVPLIAHLGKDELFITGQGPLRWDGSTFTPADPAANSFWRGVIVADACQLRDGRFAVATLEKGVAILAPDGRLLTDLSPSLSRSFPTVTYSVFQDHDGGLWITAPASINRIAIESSSVFFPREASTGAEVFLHILPAKDRLILATSTDASFFRPGYGDIVPAQLPASSETWLTNSLPVPNGTLLGSFLGVFLLEGSSARPIYTPNSPLQFLSMIPTREPGHVFVSARNEILDLDTKASTARTVLSHLDHLPIALAVDSGGRIWVDLDGQGFFTISNPYSDHARLVPPGERLPHFAEGLPDYMVGAPNHAIFFFYGDQAFYLPPNSGPIEPVVNWPHREILSKYTFGSLNATPGPDGSLWLVLQPTDTQQACVSRITLEGGRAVWRAHSVDGLWKVGLPTAIEAIPGNRRDTLLIAGSEGLLKVDEPKDAPIERPTRLSLVTLAQSSSDPSLHLVSGPLPYSVRRVVIRVAVPDYLNRPVLRPEIRIDGIDSSWVAFDGNSERELTNLRDGTYVAHVRVLQTETGATSVEAPLRFRVNPPWWRSVWAITLDLAALGGAIVFGYHYRERLLLRKAASLEEMVARRTEQLTKARAQADKANAAKSDFIARVSHNIRNPLNGIVGISLALADSDLEPRQRELVSTLDSCARQLTSLIDDVLDFSRIEAGKVTLRPAPCSPRSILAAVASSLSAQAKAADSVLECKLDPSLPDFVMLDEHRLQEILLNYTNNAIRYAPGHIVISASRSIESGEVLECSVRDKGSGFTHEEKALLFTNFTRLSTAKSLRPGGTGLGLALCRRLADLMGGTVGVDTAPGLGSRFYVSLPLIIAAPPAAPKQSHFRIARALIVEDADYNSWAFAAILAHVGAISSDRAKDGREAIEFFMKHDYDVILLDRNLPDIDGTEVAKRMRRLEAGQARTLIICVSAYSTTEDRDLCLASGMDYFAGKPLTPDKLAAVFREAGVGSKPVGPTEMPPPERFSSISREGNLDNPKATASPSPQPPVDPSNIDTAPLAFLANYGPPYSEQVDRYIATLTDHLQTLTKAIPSGDFAAIERTAHMLSGHAKFVNAAPLAALAAQTEKAARSKSSATLPALAEQLKQAADAVVAEFLRSRPFAG